MKINLLQNSDQIGTIAKESCGSEPTTLTNYTDSMSISLLNAPIDQSRFRNGIIGLMMAEMSNKTSAVNQTPSGCVPQQPIIVVQPPAQQIYFNQPPTSSDHGFSYDTSRIERNVQSK